MKIKVFVHLNDLPGAFDVMSEQLTRMSESGLLETADQVFLCSNGKDDNFLPAQGAMIEYPNVKFIHTSNFTNHWEFPTLDMVKRNCDAADENFAVCYFHLKGLSRLNDQRVVDWRHFMEYWTIDRWEDSFNKIKEGYDLVGTNIIEKPWLHSSGNFWWSHADYIKKLEKLPHPDKIQWGTPSKWINAVLDNGNFRYEHEAWVGTGDPKWFEICATPGKDTPGWHFENLYPESNYVQAS
jgi:hypothetical protein